MGKSTKPNDARRRLHDPKPKLAKQPNAQRHGLIETRNGETLLTPAMHAEIVGWVKAGSYATEACAVAGIATVTYYDWLKRGARGEEPFAAFANAIKKAVAFAEARAAGRIVKAGQKNWQANAWYLERKHHGRWGRKDHMTMAGDADAPLTIGGPRTARHDPKRLTAEQRALLMELREAMRVPDDNEPKGAQDDE